MSKRPRTKDKRLKKDIFRTGEYVQHFTPEDKWNPFSRIYKQKKEDTLRIIDQSEGARSILDVGGGMGRLSLALAKSAGNKVITADLSIDMLKLVAKERGEADNLEIVNADAHQLPFRDKSFDHIIGLDLLCHLEEPRRALGEFRRVLKDEGRLIMDSTNSNPLWALFYPRYLGKNPLNWFRTMKFKGVSPGWEQIVKHYRKNEFLSLLEEMGFQVLRNINYGPALCPKWHLAVSRKNF